MSLRRISPDFYNSKKCITLSSGVTEFERWFEARLGRCQRMLKFPSLALFAILLTIFVRGHTSHHALQARDPSQFDCRSDFRCAFCPSFHPLKKPSGLILAPALVRALKHSISSGSPLSTARRQRNGSSLGASRAPVQSAVDTGTG